MTHEQMAKAFNEWLRRYIDEPERFEREFQMVGQFLHEEACGSQPTYGESCAAYLRKLVDEASGS